eukprot:3060403-Amphidinium_carterae.1
MKQLASHDDNLLRSCLQQVGFAFAQRFRPACLLSCQDQARIKKLLHIFASSHLWGPTPTSCREVATTTPNDNPQQI